MDQFDITIVGGGPAGLFALFYAGMRGARAQLIEALPELGGQLYALYPEKTIYDMPGFPAISAADLVKGCAEQAMQWPHTVCLDERLAEISGDVEQSFRIRTDKNVYRAKTVVLCTGVGAFTPRRLSAPSADRFEGNGLHYYARNLQQFEGRHVVIVGGGDSALDYALALEPIAAGVTVVHRSKFRAHPDTVARVEQSRIQVYQPDFEVTALHGDGYLEAITYANRKTNEELTTRCDAVLAALGFISDVGQLRAWGLEVDGNGVIVHPSTMETSVRGVFAAGDVISHDAKLKLIACATSEAAIAIAQAMAYARPGQKIGTMHSSNMELPIAGRKVSAI